MKFYYENLRNATITYSGTADSNYPESNLNDVSKNTLFKDTGFTGTTYLDFDFGEPRTCNSIVLGNQDITGVTLALLYSTDDVTYNTAFFGVSPRDDLIEFASYDAQYWRLVFVNDPLTNNVSIGNIYLGTYLELNHNPELIGTTEAQDIASYVFKSETKYKFGTILQSDETDNYGYRYEGCSDIQKNEIEVMAKEIGVGNNDSAYPFYFYQDELVFARQLGRLVFEKIAYDNWTVNFNFETEL